MTNGSTITFIGETDEAFKGLQHSQQYGCYYEDDYDDYEGECWCTICFVSLVVANGLSQNEGLSILIMIGFIALTVVVVILKL